jgi:hypothetical protein
VFGRDFRGQLEAPMTKISVLAALVAAGLCMPALDAAQAEPPERGGPRHEWAGEGHKFSAEDFAALTDARIAALKTGLKLNAAQEKNWPALESALREGAKARAARMDEWREHARDDHERHDAIEAMQRRAKSMQERATRLVALADAAKPLYESLDEGQKHRFGVVMREMRGHRGGRWGRN